MQERRITDQLQNYWDKLRNGRHFPTRADVRPQDLEGLWEDCFIVSAHGGDFQFDYLGLHFFESYGETLKGVERKIYDKLIEGYSAQILKRARTVVMSKAPLVDEVTQEHEDEDLILKYRLCLLPLSNDGSEVSHILGGMRWKGK